MPIYLDNAATTRVCEEAAKTAYEVMTEDYGNPSSSHSFGRAAKRELDAARETVAKSMGAEVGEIYFTSGGTEGNNWALICGAKAARRPGSHILSSAAEHDAVLNTLDMLEASGYEVTRLKPGTDGSVSPSAVEAALREDTAVVSLMLVNNETGSVTDIREISKIIKKLAPRALLHTDAAQAYLKIPFSVNELGADIITISGHKLHAPKGIGALYIRKNIQLPPLLRGGPQEGGKRAGTEATPLIAAFSAAVKSHLRGADEILYKMRVLRELAATRLTAEIPGLRVIGGGAPQILCVSMPGYKSESLVNFLEARGISVSKSSACKKGARSHVLQAAGLPADVIDGALRISFSRYNTESDVDALCGALRDAGEKLLTVCRRGVR